MYAPVSPASAICGFRYRACWASWRPGKREDILRAYPYLEAADIDEALRYAASLAEDEVIEFAG
jgi:hypothetical protein